MYTLLRSFLLFFHCFVQAIEHITVAFSHKRNSRKLLVFCHRCDLLVTGLRVVQFRGNRGRNLKSASRYALGRFEITRPSTPWIALPSVLLPLLIIIVIIIIIIYYYLFVIYYYLILSIVVNRIHYYLYYYYYYYYYLLLFIYYLLLFNT